MLNWKSIKVALWAWVKRKPRQAVVVGLVLLLVGYGVVRSFTKSGPAQVTYHPVKRSDFLISIVEGGTVKAVREVTVRSELEGTARILSIMPEGTYAKKGDLLVELDSADLRERLNAQEVVRQNSQFAFVQAKESLSIQKSLIESNVKDAELVVEFAGSDLEKYKEGDWPQQRRLVETKITVAQEELQRARDRNNYTIQLEKKGYATKTELEADSLAAKLKEFAVAQYSEELHLLTKYDYPKAIRKMESKLDQARLELQRLKQRSAAAIASYEEDLNTKQKTLDLQQTRLQQMKEQLNLTKIFAPQDGLVIYASSSSPGSGILIEEGATVRQKQDLIKLPDISQMLVEVRVHESHVQKIKPGLSAYVTIDSIPDKQFRGTVRKVGVLPDSTSRYYNPNLKVYATEVLIEEGLPPDLKPGISGRAEIIITNLVNVLTVPIQAVTTVKGQQVVFVEKGSGHVAVPVGAGLYNDRLIEIKSGLSEGQRVLLSPQSASDNIDLSGSIVAHEEKKSEATNTAGEASGKINGDSSPPAGEKKSAAVSPGVHSDRKKAE
jgi:HlyD family secretion protein